jgi:CheY-like chemotaxis protein
MYINKQMPLAQGDSRLVRRQTLALVVDDEEMIRRMVGEQLTELGFRVLLASSGDDAYELARDNPDIDLIVTDVRMPGKLNGFDLLERLLGKYPSVRSIVMSGFTGEATTRFGLANAYLRKPFTMSFLERHVCEVMAT